MNNMPKWWGNYTNWLLNGIHFYGPNYTRLMKTLNSTDFTYILDKDENRAIDGLCLREDYYDYYLSYNNDADVIRFRPCTVLEMLCALTLRIEEEYLGDPANPHPEESFCEMLENLGLFYFDDYKYESNVEKVEEEVRGILRDWMNRDFDTNGQGSIFPIKRPKKDQRKIEIWSQMMEYITEKEGVLHG